MRYAFDLRQLHTLVDAGNTGIVIGYDIQVIARSDWVIDVGLGGGDEGGRIIAQGPPERIGGMRHSQTARYLAAALSHGSAKPDRQWGR
jgi:excinuclease ABC subunit A